MIDKPRTETTDEHVFRLRHGYLTITQDASAPEEHIAGYPAQTVWLSPEEVRKLLEFLKTQTEK